MIDEIKYTGNEFKLSSKRRGEGYDLAPFNMKVVFNPLGNYYHVISDYVDTPPVGIAGERGKDIRVYPTFFDKYIMIQGDEDGMSVELYNVSGNKLIQTYTGTSICRLENLDIPRGVYLLRVSTRNNETVTRRVIKY